MKSTLASNIAGPFKPETAPRTNTHKAIDSYHMKKGTDTASTVKCIVRNLQYKSYHIGDICKQIIQVEGFVMERLLHGICQRDEVSFLYCCDQCRKLFHTL